MSDDLSYPTANNNSQNADTKNNTEFDMRRLILLFLGVWILVPAHADPPEPKKRVCRNCGITQ
jgi:hypothetical protein